MHSICLNASSCLLTAYQHVCQDILTLLTLQEHRPVSLRPCFFRITVPEFKIIPCRQLLHKWILLRHKTNIFLKHLRICKCICAIISRLPPSALRLPASISRRVDLPQPLAPTMAIYSPLAGKR